MEASNEENKISTCKLGLQFSFSRIMGVAYLIIEITGCPTKRK